MTMVRLRIRVYLHSEAGPARRLPLVLAMLLVAGLLTGILGSGHPAMATGSVNNTATAAGVRRPSYYLTDLNYDADQALAACASGYHMASLWELLDVSTLIYAYDHPDAHTKDDSGQGPPAEWYGWVRTGWDSSASDIAGIGNCQAWTSTASSDYGSIARLDRNWTTSPTAAAPWDTRAFYCGGISPVWCMETLDRISQTFLPLVLRL